jgi:adenosylmethionine-8-amino-7-oxononanoate aminotransferase
MWMIELIGPSPLDARTWLEPSGKLAPAELVHRSALGTGVFLGVYSPYCVWMVPPFTIGERELTRSIEALDQALSVADVAFAHLAEDASKGNWASSEESR